MFKKRTKKNNELLFNVKSKANFDDLMERPLEKKIFLSYIFFIMLILSFFVWKLIQIQIFDYQKYSELAKKNFLKSEVLFSERGIILDRNNNELVWNEKQEDKEFPKRKYLENIGLSHILGFLSYPKKDKWGKYFTKEYTGKAGIEKHFNDYLNGKLGKKLLKMDAKRKIISQNALVLPESGKNLNLTIDLNLQKILFNALDNYLKEDNFVAGAGIIMNANTGEILASVSLPEYSSGVMTEKTDRKTITTYFRDKKNIFLNRVFLGGYTPGSIIKPFVAMMGLENNIINDKTKFHTTGKLILPNKWNPKKPTIFSDWKNHGTVDVYKAIAFSSNIFFYIVGGGLNGIKNYQNREGLGIKRLNVGYHNFGFGEKTELERFKEKDGLIPNPEWKQKIFKRKWNIGNTYFVSIGQFGFLTTPLQALVAIASIANDGNVLKPRISKISKTEIRKKIPYSQKNLNIVKKAMRKTVLDGTTKSLNLDFVNVASKSGTAQIKNNTRNNAWVIGFWPLKKPKFVFLVLGDDGPIKHRSASYVMRDVFLDMKKNNMDFYFKE